MVADGGAVALTAGEDRVVVDPGAGGRLASLVAAGAERLVGAPTSGDRARSTLWGCFLMAPWAGRVAGSRLHWRGDEITLTPNLGPHAIHGVAFDRGWRVTDADEHALHMTCPLGWPLGGTVEQHVQLAAGRLDLVARVRAGDRPMPAGVGWHPWFRRPDTGDCAVRLDAREVLGTDQDLIPTGRRLPVRGDTDLRRGPALGPRRLDHVYVDPRSPALVTWPDLRLEIAFAPPLGTVVVHTPSAGFCVEPQTAWPDAVALAGRGVEGTGLAALGPGETLEAATAWTWST